MDDRVWLHISEIAEARGLEYLDANQLAYYATRLWEYEIGSGGPTAFIDVGGEDVAAHVAAGYRKLGRPQAALAFERVWNSKEMQAMRDDPDIDRTDDVIELALAVGEHDDARWDLIQSHPESFRLPGIEPGPSKHHEPMEQPRDIERR